MFCLLSITVKLPGQNKSLFWLEVTVTVESAELSVSKGARGVSKRFGPKVELALVEGHEGGRGEKSGLDV